LSSRWLFTKNLSWQAKQSILHTIVTFYGDCVKLCEDFTPNLATKELAVASQQCTISHFLFHLEFLTKNNMSVILHQPHFSLFPRLKIKLKDRHSDITEVTEAELCAEHAHRTWLPGCI
jgi:hypothetical protein